MKKPCKFQPLASFQIAKGAPLSGVGKILSDVYASRAKPLIKLPKRFDYQGKPSHVSAADIMTGGQVRDINGEVWTVEKRGDLYVATS